MKPKYHCLFSLYLVFICYSCFADETKQTYEIRLNGGTFFGPGAMVDSPMPHGNITNIEFSDYLTGETPFFNNGNELPNIVVDERFASLENAVLSNGEKYNEHMNGGIVDIGMGAMSLVNLVTANGPNKGIQYYSIDNKLNWNITTDLALDPGYTHGLLTINNLLITTGVSWIPISKQTQMEIPGGSDTAGSLESGSAIVGKLGDEDKDGYLDGILVGQSVIPIDHLFSPGAPAAQMRTFSSNIPVEMHDAILLTLVGIQNYQEVWEVIKINSNVNNFTDDWNDYFAQIEERISSFGELIVENKKDTSIDLIPIKENTRLVREMIDSKNFNNSSTEEFVKLNEELFSQTKAVLNSLLDASTVFTIEYYN